MAKFWAVLLLVGLYGFAAGATIAQADGLRFGLWRFPGMYFGGPRYDGPRYYDYGDPGLDGPDMPPPHYGRRFNGPPPPPVPGPPDALPPEEPLNGEDDVRENGGRPGRRAIEPHPPGPRICYSQAETRERIASEKLREPFALMRSASTYARADALAGKLCRWNDEYIYEISLLRPDGRVIHVFMNAATGQVVGALNAH